MYTVIKYVINFKDRIYINVRQKINKLLLYTVLLIIAILVGVYLYFNKSGEAFTRDDSLTGILLAYGSTIAYVIYIFWWIFHDYSLGLKGEIKWNINKQEESDVWEYQINAKKRSRDFEETGSIKEIEENRKFIVIVTSTKREYVIIKKKLTEEEINFLLQVKKELDNKNINVGE